MANILLLLADDLGYGDLSCYGCPDIRTPSLDKLAGEGVRFTRFYSNAPECTPSRTALLTGRYQQRVGGLECAIGLGGVGRYDEAEWLASKGELGLPETETTIGAELSRAGYDTCICGKWHLGYEEKFSPMRHGFRHAYSGISIFGSGSGRSYTRPPLRVKPHMSFSARQTPARAGMGSVCHLPAPRGLESCPREATS